MGIRTTIEYKGKTYTGEYGKVVHTLLGFEDHGIFTFYLTIDFHGAGQSTPAYSLGPKTGKAIRELLETLDVRSWEELKGKSLVALYKEHAGAILGLANPATGKVFLFEEVFSDTSG